MTPAEYRNARPGLLVRSTRPLSNSLGRVPAGMMFVVRKKHGGFDLEASEPCQCCGFRFRVSRVDRTDVEVA